MNEGRFLVMSAILISAAIPLGCNKNGGSDGNEAADRNELLKELGETPLDDQLSKIPFPKERVLADPGTYKYDLSQLVGHALYLEKDPQGSCQAYSEGAFDPILLSPESYVKPDAKLESQTINTLLFDRKVSKGGSAELSVLGLGPSVSDSNVAQLTIVETAFLNYKDGDLVQGWKAKVNEAIALTGCPALLVRGAKVRVATAKFFQRFEPKLGVDTKLLGAVFKANGNIYRETDGFEAKTLVSITTYLIRPGQQPVVETTPHSTVFPKFVRVPNAGLRNIPATLRFRKLLEDRGIIRPKATNH